MRVICVQSDIHWEDKAANFARVRRLLEAHRPAAGSLIVLPEMFATGFSMNVAEIAEAEGGETRLFLQDLAGDTACAVLAGVVARHPDGRGLNQAVALAPTGEELCRYSKLHPFSFAGEDRCYAPGATVETFVWDGLTVAPLICYDLRFPEAYRRAARQRAEVLVTIASFPAARVEHWLTLNAARAIENQAYVVAVNRCGKDPKSEYSGRSLVIDPRGRVLTDGGAEEGVFACDLDPTALRRYRQEFPALADMRSDLLPGPARVSVSTDAAYPV